MSLGGTEIFVIPAFIVGILLLYKGSDILVDGTVKTAMHLGVSTLVISVLLVGFGTSAPEFAISAGAAIQGESEISLGNVIGSCIANLFLVLGLSSFIRPITIQKGIIRRELPIMLGATVVVVIFSFIGLLDEYHLIGGTIFLLLFALFVAFFVHCAHKERKTKKNVDTGKTSKNILFIVFGLAGVIIGAYALIWSAINIAEMLRINPMIIALSMVAIGTSLPELVVSAAAAYKGESDIAVGNVLGSNVFNLLLILGFAALFIPLGATGALDSIMVLLLTTIVIVPILYTGHEINRIEGFLMLAVYAIYIWYIFFGCHIILPYF